MEINGLPLHALVVHAAVVLGPLAALVGLAYAAVPRRRAALSRPLALVAVLTAVAVWTSYLSGEQVRDANAYGGPLTALVERHEDHASVLRIVATGFALVSLAALRRPARGPRGLLLAVLVGVGAAATGVWTLLTGDAGAQIAWFGVEG